MDAHFFTVVLLLLLLFLSCACFCDRCPHHSKASLFPSTADVNDGACGYGPLAARLNGGYIAAASHDIFRDGDGCGGCYELKCRGRRLCREDGVKVIVTDAVNEEMNGTAFVLSKEAFMALVQEGMAHDELMRLEMVDVEFRRIPCEYKNKNLAIRVEEMSRKPRHLAIKFLYQGGQTDITAVEVAQVGSASWQYLTRHSGPIWRTSHTPPGPLQLRLVVTAGSGGKWVWVEKEVLPSDWQPGEIYDTGVQITDIALETCLSCAKEELR